MSAGSVKKEGEKRHGGHKTTREGDEHASEERTRGRWRWAAEWQWVAEVRGRTLFRRFRTFFPRFWHWSYASDRAGLGGKKREPERWGAREGPTGIFGGAKNH